MDQGFDEFFGFTSATDGWEKYPATLADGREMKPSTGYADTLFADRATDFIRRHRNRPFLLYVPFTNPHFHVRAPEEDAARFAGRFPNDSGEYPPRAHYAAMIERLDLEAGRVVEAIDRNGLARDTLIVFSSDQGATFESGNRGASHFHDSNGPFRGQKRTLWEGGIRVPAIVRWTGRLPARTVSNRVVHMIDLFPTLVKAGRGDPARFPGLDGLSQLESWIAGTALPDRTLFWEWRSEGTWQAAAMRGDRKLVVTGDQSGELFDVTTDPAERRNLRPAETLLTTRLLGELQAWLDTEGEASKLGKPNRTPVRLR
jgi:arylsulfatase A-like enzyme